MRVIPYRKLWAGLLLLIVLSPIGLVLPESLNASGAWGEWSAEELRTMLGYVPVGLAQLEKVWKALLPGYAIPGMEKPWQARLAYLVSGIVGAGVVLVIALALGRRLTGQQCPAATPSGRSFQPTLKR